MTCRTRNFITRLVGCLVAATVFVIVSSTGLAQNVPAGVGPPPEVNPRAQDQVRRVAEGRLRSAEIVTGLEDENQKRIQAAIANVKEDFARIQVVRNVIARNLVARKPLEYKLISEQSGEINKRANRLKLYMMSQAPENKEKEQNGLLELKNEDMIGALVKLCKLVDSFTENPSLLKNGAIVDSTQLEKAKADKARADADLLGIIKLSEDIHRKADNISKEPE